MLEGDGSTPRTVNGPVALPHPDTLDHVLGLQVLELSPTLARGAVELTDRVRQRWGLLHGGAYAALAELLASEATTTAVEGESMLGVGLSNHTSFLRPITSGTAHAVARCRHAGGTTWVWEVDICDDDGRLCCVARVTVAVRPLPEDERRS